MNGRSEFPSAGETARHLEDVADDETPEAHGAVSRTSPDGSVTVTVPCDEAGGELP